MSAIVTIRVKPHVTMGEIERLIRKGIEFNRHGSRYYFESDKAPLIKLMQAVNK